MRRIASYICLAFALVLVAVGLSSCNARKKNTAAARQYTAFITRYNIHYNGDKHYKETLADMETKYEDNYSDMLLMHPAEARADQNLTQPSGDFNRSIEKAQKAIQLRSITKKPAKKRGKASDPEYKAWMKREEYNPFLHNDWLMMGRSQYMNGDFAGAAATFFYTSRHFNWLPGTVLEAQLWQARSYLAMDWLFEAETILNRIKPEQLTTRRLTDLYNYDYGDLYLRSHDYAKAAPFLAEAVKTASGAQKTRLNFLLGQVYQQLGDKKAAYEAYKRAGSASSATYRTKFNARIHQSEVFDGQDIEGEVKALRRMTRYDRNKEYLDQVYYAIGNLYLSRRDTAKAIENYELAAKKSTRNGIEKALAQVTLGNLYYERRDYEKAQPCYAEAVPLLPKTYPGVDSLKRRSDVLDELAVYSQNVHLQDSLLRLADMDSVRLRGVIDGIIADLKKKEKEEADETRRQEYLADQAAKGSALQSNTQTPATFGINSDNSWYFYNQSARTAGKTEFQRRWGSRKLEDDWRRRNKSSFNTGDFDAGGDDVGDDSAPADSTTAAGANDTPQARERQQRESDPHFPEYYYKQIPRTEAEKQTCNDVIQEGLYNMGVILKDKLEDYPAAQAEFDRLLVDYPDNIYRLDVYYNLYLMYMREGNTRLADRYRSLIMSNFAESKQAIALRDPNYIDNLRRMDADQERLYEQMFDAYMADDNKAVHAIYNDVSERYPMSKLMPRFMFLEALSLATDRRPEEFKSTLRDMLERYPDTDLSTVASAWLKGLAAGRELRAGASGKNMTGISDLWATSFGNDSTATDNAGIQFELNPADKQLLVFVYPTDRVSTNELLYQIARHNFRSFVVKDFDLEPMNFGRLGMIAVKDFDNLDELNHYRRVMAASTDFKLPAGVRPVVISAKNFDTLLHSNGSLDDYFRFLEEQNYKDAQADILPYEEIEELPEPEPSPAAPVHAPAVEPQPVPAPEVDDDPDIPATTDPAKPAQTKPAPNKPTPATPATPAKPEPTKPAPKPAAPATPVYDPGSEGDDDPLLQ